MILEENPKDRRWPWKKKGVGCLCLTCVDVGVLLQLRCFNPAISNNSYVANLFRLIVTIISSSVNSTFFDNIGPYKGNPQLMKKVPSDKYHPKNIVIYNDYLAYIASIPPWCIKFGDEKSMKGEEVFNHTGRVTPTIGKKPQLIVPIDFCNTFCIMGLITIDRTVSPPLLF